MPLLSETRIGVTNLQQKIANNIRFEYVGEWKKLDWVLRYFTGRGFGPSIKRDLAKGQRDFLEVYKRTIIKALLTEGDSVRARFETWSPKYKRQGGSIGIRSSNYLNALMAMRPIAQQYSVSMNLPRDAAGTKSAPGGLTLAKYALYFEYGSPGKRQPARPLWGSSFKHMGGKARLMGIVTGSIGKRLNQQGIRVSYAR